MWCVVNEMKFFNEFSEIDDTINTRESYYKQVRSC